MKRRGFLLGASALVASPAVIRVAQLMPIVPLAHFGPNGVLTLDMLNAEYLRQLARAGAQPASLATTRWPPVSHVRRSTILFGSHDLHNSIEEVSERVLAPLARTLVRERVLEIVPASPIHTNPEVKDASSLRVRGLEGNAFADYDLAYDALEVQFVLKTR